MTPNQKVNHNCSHRCIFMIRCAKKIFGGLKTAVTGKEKLTIGYSMYKPAVNKLAGPACFQEMVRLFLHRAPFVCYQFGKKDLMKK